MQNKINSNELDNNIKNGISSATCQVAKCLGRYPPGKRLMKKINDTYYDMSGVFQQKIKLAAKLSCFLKYIDLLR